MKATFNVSLTETKQFRRLVEFVVDVESYARITADEELQEMVDGLRFDLGVAST